MKRKTPILLGIILAAILVFSLTAAAMLILANDEAKEHSQVTDHSQALDETTSAILVSVVALAIIILWLLVLWIFR